MRRGREHAKAIESAKSKSPVPGLEFTSLRWIRYLPAGRYWPMISRIDSCMAHRGGRKGGKRGGRKEKAAASRRMQLGWPSWKLQRALNARLLHTIAVGERRKEREREYCSEAVRSASPRAPHSLKLPHAINFLTRAREGGTRLACAHAWGKILDDPDRLIFHVSSTSSRRLAPRGLLTTKPF